jgi:hypothetical protein
MGEGDRARMREEEEKELRQGWARKPEVNNGNGQKINKEDRTGMGEENVECKIDRDGREKKQGPISDLGWRGDSHG